MANHLCERCQLDLRVSGERFCKACRKMVLAELQEAKFLTITPRVGLNTRSLDQREDVYETKHGRD